MFAFVLVSGQLDAYYVIGLCVEYTFFPIATITCTCINLALRFRSNEYIGNKCQVFCNFMACNVNCKTKFDESKCDKYECKLVTWTAMRVL